MHTVLRRNCTIYTHINAYGAQKELLHVLGVSEIRCISSGMSSSHYIITTVYINIGPCMHKLTADVLCYSLHLTHFQTFLQGETPKISWKTKCLTSCPTCHWSFIKNCVSFMIAWPQISVSFSAVTWIDNFPVGRAVEAEQPPGLHTHTIQFRWISTSHFKSLCIHLLWMTWKLSGIELCRAFR
jgi:hypothetical protein